MHKIEESGMWGMTKAAAGHILGSVPAGSKAFFLFVRHLRLTKQLKSLTVPNVPVRF